jgi:hypothetical protein
MILRGIFGLGLFCLCLAQGQDTSLAFPKSPLVLERLEAMKLELDSAAQKPPADRGEFP